MAMFVQQRSLALDVADEIATAATLCAAKNDFGPIAVSVLDCTGSPIVTKRMDGCMSEHISSCERKARTSLRWKKSSRAFAEQHLDGAKPADVVSILSQIGEAGDISPGAVLLKCSESGKIVGAIGCSGASTGDEDEYCAISAVWASAVSNNLITEPAEHSCSTVAEDDDEEKKDDDDDTFVTQKSTRDLV